MKCTKHNKTSVSIWLNHNLTTGSKDSCAEQETFVIISMADDYDTINIFYFMINISQSASSGSQLSLTKDSCEEAVSYLRSPEASTQVIGIGRRVIT